MSYNFLRLAIKKPSLYYFLLVLVAILFPLTYYPRIYGTDGFQIIWMANAIREGALFSDNTWLISPFSYFGYYPFSHRAIGVPMFLGFLITLLNFFSFGIFGMTEVILAYNIILIILIYKSSRNLGNRLFEEEWSRFVFVAAMLLSPYIIYRTTMDVDTRIIITIIMIVLLNLNLKVLNNDNKNIKKFKTTIFLFLLLLVGAFAHRLWLATIITVVFMIFTIIILKYKILQKLTVILILPLSIIAFFVGLEIFGLDPLKIWSPFFDNSTLIGASTNLSINYALQAGLMILFFPVGVIITLYKLSIILRKSDDKKTVKLNNVNPYLLRKSYYLLLFIVAFLFMAPSFYATTIFLPIIIIFSVKGLIYFKKFLGNVSERLERLFPLGLLFLSVGYSFLYVEIILNINLWYLFVIIIFSISIYLLIFIINKYGNILTSKVSFDSVKLQKELRIFILVISVLIFTTTTVEGRLRSIDSSPYPWENRYLTDEEIEIIDYLKNEEIDGWIFTSAGILVAEKLAGVGFLPVFSKQTKDGKSLYYGFITPNEVHADVEFRLYSDILIFFYLNDYTVKYPIRILINSIKNYNVTNTNDLYALQTFNLQYIITINNTILSNGGNQWPLEGENQWPLILSLPFEFEPVFSTQHYLVWRIY